MLYTLIHLIQRKDLLLQLRFDLQTRQRSGLINQLLTVSGLKVLQIESDKLRRRCTQKEVKM